MDKKLAGLLGAAAALATMSSAQAAAPVQQSEIAPATSYRDLLDPVPNALSALKADDARLAESQGTQDQSTRDGVRVAQISVQVGIIITTITIITAVSSFASGRATLATIITTITTIIIITTEMMEGRRGIRPDAPLLFSFTGSFADLGFCRTEQMAVRAVEDGVGFRGPR